MWSRSCRKGGTFAGSSVHVTVWLLRVTVWQSVRSLGVPGWSIWVDQVLVFVAEKFLG